MNKPAMVMVVRQFSRYRKLLEFLQSRTFCPAKRRRVYLSLVRTASGWHLPIPRRRSSGDPNLEQFVFRNEANPLKLSRAE